MIYTFFRNGDLSVKRIFPDHTMTFPGDWRYENDRLVMNITTAYDTPTGVRVIEVTIPVVITTKTQTQLC